MGRLSDDWKYDEIKPRPAKDRERAAKRIVSMPYEEAVKEMEKLHSEFNIGDYNDISMRIREKTKGNPDNYGVKDKEEPKYEVVNDKSIDAIKDNFTPPGAKDKVDMTIYKEDEDRFGKDALKGLTGPRESEQLKDDIDTNDNGKIEKDEMADFQKSLDDYAAKNKKGRDDIPAVTTRR